MTRAGILTFLILLSTLLIACGDVQKSPGQWDLAERGGEETPDEEDPVVADDKPAADVIVPADDPEEGTCAVAFDTTLTTDDECSGEPDLAVSPDGTPHITWLTGLPAIGHHASAEDGREFSVDSDVFGVDRLREVQIAAAAGQAYAVVSGSDGDVSLWSLGSVGSPGWSHVRTLPGINVLPDRRSISMPGPDALRVLTRATRETETGYEWGPLFTQGFPLSEELLDSSTSADAGDLALAPDGSWHILYWLEAEHFVISQDGTLDTVPNVKTSNRGGATLAAFDDRIFVYGPRPGDDSPDELIIDERTTDGSWKATAVFEQSRRASVICDERHPDPEEGTRCEVERTAYPWNGHLLSGGDSLALVQGRADESLEMVWTCGAYQGCLPVDGNDDDMYCSWEVENEDVTGSLMVADAADTADLETMRVPGLEFDEASWMDAVIDDDGDIHVVIAETRRDEPMSCEVRYARISCDQ